MSEEILSRETMSTWRRRHLRTGLASSTYTHIIDSHKALRERVEKLERVAEAAKKVTPYIPEVGEITVCYKSLTDETNVVTQEVQDIIWGLTNDYDDARAALESDHE